MLFAICKVMLKFRLPSSLLSDTENIELLSTGPAVDPSQCVGAIVSNGRIFYTSHGSGLQISQVYGAEATSPAAPWETTSADAP